MTVINDVMLIRGGTLPNVCIFYDEEKSNALAAMQKYVKQNGFTITTQDGRFTIKDVVLRERESTGKVIKTNSYCELFDVVTDTLL